MTKKRIIFNLRKYFIFRFPNVVALGKKSLIISNPTQNSQS